MSLLRQQHEVALALIGAQFDGEALEDAYTQDMDVYEYDEEKAMTVFSDENLDLSGSGDNGLPGCTSQVHKTGGGQHHVRSTRPQGCPLINPESFKPSNTDIAIIVWPPPRDNIHRHENRSPEAIDESYLTPPRCNVFGRLPANSTPDFEASEHESWLLPHERRRVQTEQHPGVSQILVASSQVPDMYYDNHRDVGVVDNGATAESVCELIGVMLGFLLLYLLLLAIAVFAT